MIIIDGSWTFDTEKMIEYAAKEEQDRTSYERDVLNQFKRYAYWQYKRIRDCVSPSKCRPLRLQQIKETLTDQEKLKFTTNLLKTTAEEVFFILDFVERYLDKIY